MSIKPIILLGSGNSGSGAVKDYLCTRGDLFDPLGGAEFRLIQEKGGLSSLHASMTTEFHPEKASYAVFEFIELAKRLGNSSKKLSIPPKVGYGFATRIPNYESAIACFINDITDCSFGITTLTDLLDLGTLDWIRYMTGRTPKFSRYLKPFPVTKEVFLERTSELFRHLFFENPADPKDKLGYVFDQAGSFWSPTSSTQYFGEHRKVIVVSRDPRDIYTQQFKLYRGGVSEFVKYYNSIMAHITSEELFSPCVLHIEFNSFVLDYDNEYIRLCDFLNIPHEITSKYDPKLSTKNVGVYKKFLAPEESDFISNNCVKVGKR
ncbi:hypothetical protein N9J15_03520 [Porticoccaceae bacterium]|nr:hypothetical protein [Porticoccaceae bacterium]